MQNQSKIDQNGAKEHSESDLGSKSVPGFQKSGHGFEKWMQFLRHLGDFGRHFQFYNVSVVLTYYEEIKNFIENPCQNGCQK